MARVYVTDEVWADFRAAVTPYPLNVKLGELVQREVDRYRSRRLRMGQLDDQELVDALGRARELHDELAAIIAGLERRLGRTSGGDTPSESWWGERLIRRIS